MINLSSFFHYVCELKLMFFSSIFQGQISCHIIGGCSLFIILYGLVLTQFHNQYSLTLASSAENFEYGFIDRYHKLLDKIRSAVIASKTPRRTFIETSEAGWSAIRTDIHLNFSEGMEARNFSLGKTFNECQINYGIAIGFQFI